MARYDAETPVLGDGTASAAQIERWFAQRGPGYAARYAPDGQYWPAPAGIGAAIVTEARRLGINHDLAAAQILHETAAWQSRFARERNNPGGLGAVNNNPDAALRFATPAEGIRAHMAHLATYARGEGPWTADDPRYAATPPAWRGSVRVLRDLDGKWAYPGIGYGAGIARLANQLLTVEVGPMAFEMPDNINGIPVRKSFIPAGNSNRPGLPVTPEGAQWITVHETGNPSPGANAEMHRRFTHNGGGASPGNPGVSFTFVVDDSEIVWLVPLEERTWQASDGADGPGNSSTSIETCINSDGDDAKTREHLAQLVAWLATHHPQKSTERVAQHNKWARDGKDCPARMRANGGVGWNALMARVREIAATEPLYLTYADGTRCPHPVIAGFRAWVEAQGRARGGDDQNAAMLSVTGYPLEAEWRGADGLTYQRFERLTLQWTPDQAPPWDIVVLPCSASLPARAELE